MPTDQGLWDFNGQSYITLSGFRIVNSAYAGIYADGSSFITIQDNDTYNSASSGIGIWNSNHVTVNHNEVAMSGWNGWQESLTIAVTGDFEVMNNLVYNTAGYPKEGITIKDGSHDGKVYGNTIHDVIAVGLYVDAEARYTYNIEVFRNTVYSGSGDGIVLATEAGGLLDNIKVYNNISYDNAFVGLSISSCCEGAATHPIHNIQLINNTVVGNGSPWGGGIAVDSPDSQNIIVRNNLLSQNATFQLLKNASLTTTQVTIDHNLIDGNQDEPGSVTGSDYQSGDPLFTNASAHNFHLLPGSPAIDHGLALNAPANDFDGILRPQGSSHDIGAYEYVMANFWIYLPFVINW